MRGELHDIYAERTRRYLFAQSLRLLEAGISVILDWGFWTREGRRHAREFYEQRGIACEFHYIDISGQSWEKRLKKRNAAVLSGHAQAYFVDDKLAAKFAERFEAPDPDEIDIWVRG